MIDSRTPVYTTPVGDNDGILIRTYPDAGHHVTSVGCDELLNDDDCSVYPVNTNRIITFTFLPYSNTLNVSTSGTGTVTGTGINTGAGDVTEDYDYGTSFILTAHPQANAYVSWSGDCAPNGNTCTVTLDQDSEGGIEEVQAQFIEGEIPQHWLTTIGDFADITPSALHDEDTIITVTATCYEGYENLVYSGCDSVEDTSCSVTMTREKSVTATCIEEKEEVPTAKSGAFSLFMSQLLPALNANKAN